jgi:hypothetical protein
MQGCQMVCFQAKNPNLGKFMRVLQCWYILWTLGPFYVFYYILWTFGGVRGNLVYFFRFGIWYHGKSGNPDVMLGITQRVCEQLCNLSGVRDVVELAQCWFP